MKFDPNKHNTLEYKFFAFKYSAKMATQTADKLIKDYDSAGTEESYEEALTYINSLNGFISTMSEMQGEQMGNSIHKELCAQLEEQLLNFKTNALNAVESAQFLVDWYEKTGKGIDYEEAMLYLAKLTELTRGMSSEERLSKGE